MTIDDRRAGWVKDFFLDHRGTCSRPKLIFCIVGTDMLSLIVTGFAADRLVHQSDVPFWPKIFLAFFAIALLRRFWSYSISSLRKLSGQFAKIGLALAIAFVSVAGCSHLTGQQFIEPKTAMVWAALSLTALMLVRVAVSWLIRALTQSLRLTRRTVLVGGGKDADDLITQFSHDNETQVNILGVFDDRKDDRSAMKNGPARLSGSFADLGEFCKREGVDLVIVTVPTRAEERMLQILNELFQLPVDVRVSAHNSALKLNSNAYTYIGTVPMLAVLDKPLSDWDRVVKNVTDRLLAATILLCALPVMLFVAITVKLTSRGPILFKQNRYGFNDEMIGVYKFRSMYTELSDANASKLVTKSDPRVTPFGKFIRRTSLDELPQLFNVLNGEMSLVGPRPHATQAKAVNTLYENVVNGYFARHRVKPGVTGWAQINGWRGETDTFEKIERRVIFDLYYIEKWSLLFDFYIIMATPFSLVSNRNAY